MKRIQHLSLLAITGVLLVLASAMPAIQQPADLGSDKGRDHNISPRAASYVDYLFTVGISGSSGSDNARLDNPEGVAVNATGHIYVADTHNNRVQVFDNTGKYLYTISGFSNPTGVAVNSTGHVYVVDNGNHRVQVFNNAGSYQYTIGTTGVSGLGPGQFNQPYGVVVNSSGYLYVSELSNDRVQVFDNAGVHKYNITGSLSGPRGVAVNSTGHLYVADRGNNRIRVYDKAGIYLYTIGGLPYGSGDYEFYWPYGVAVNATGHLYVTDYVNHRVQVFDNAGIYQHTIGTGVMGSDNARFYNPEGVALNTTGHLFVADYNNHRVQVFNNGTPISLKLIFSSGWPDTNSTSVMLTLSAHDAAQICFSNNGTAYTGWEPYSTTKAWTLDNIAGVRTVYFKAKNDNGESAPVSNTTTYVLNPTGLSLLINSGATETSSTSVTLTPSATGATQMCFSNNGTTYTSWEAYGTSKPWTLAGGPGPKTVYFKARNSTYQALPVSAAITYILQPTGLSISINDGAADTNSTSVTLTLGATGATQMCFSNNGSTYTDWETYGISKAWTLDGGPGPKTVYFLARNGTIPAAMPVTDSITYILSPTGLSISIDGGAVDTGSASVLLTLDATGATQMCFSNNGTTYTTWEAYSTSKAWTLDNLPGNRTVFFRARNGTIEATAPVNDTITFVAPPSMILIINDGAADTDTRSVTLVIWATSADEMCFSNDGTNWYGWEPLSTIKFWGLWGEPGLKTVYLKVRNKYFTGTTSDSITYTLPPTGLSITINGGATETGSASVTLTLSATGADEMCFSNDGAAWSAWEPYGTSKAWVLSSTAGPKTVYFRARNGTIDAAELDAANITYVPPADVPTWVILIAVIVGVAAVIIVLRRQGRGRVVRPDFGGERKTRLGLLKGKISQLKGKIFKQDASGVATGEKRPDEKVTEVAMKPAPELAPKPVPAFVPEKKMEIPKPTSKPEPTVTPTPVPKPATKPEITAVPAPAPQPTPAPAPAEKAAAPKPATKPAKKASKKAAKKQA